MSKPMLDHEVRVEFIRLCRLLIRGRERIGREIGNLCIAQSEGRMLMIQMNGYLTICDEITGMEFNYYMARHYLPQIRKLAVLEMLADV